MTKLVLIVTLAASGMMIAACGGNTEDKKAETKTTAVNVNASAANSNAAVKAADADDLAAQTHRRTTVRRIARVRKVR